MPECASAQGLVRHVELMSQPDPHAASQTNARPWYKKKRWIIPLGLIALCIVVTPFTGNDKDSANASSNVGVTAAAATSEAAATVSAAKHSEAENEPATQAPKPKKKKTITSGQRNALGQAENYLDFQAFSRKGLIKQLRFEKFTTSDATFAVDHVGADWNAQAVKKAKEYLDTQSFSRPGLIQQLEFEGFTSSQAKHGVAKAY